jgi:hypothetical protein
VEFSGTTVTRDPSLVNISRDEKGAKEDYPLIRIILE